MVYSIQNGAIICSHANHRGDVIARSSDTGSLTYFALYEAYGTRPYEYNPSGDPDRQKANTKEEEKDIDLLNEGMRYRDLETGTFLTRDPIGYADGPNVYCYVHCNPITHFDAWGLSKEECEKAGEKLETATTEAVDAISAHQEAIRNEQEAEEKYKAAQEAYEKDPSKDTKLARDKAKASHRKAQELSASAGKTRQEAMRNYYEAKDNYLATAREYVQELGAEKTPAEKYKELTERAAAADLLPVGALPYYGQAAGQALDLLAWALTGGELIGEFGQGNISLSQFLLASNLNNANLIIGTVGNASSFVGVTLLSGVEYSIASAAEGITSEGKNYNIMEDSMDGE